MIVMPRPERSKPARASPLGKSSRGQALRSAKADEDLELEAAEDSLKEEAQPEQYEVETIAAHEDDNQGGRTYYVKWKGYSSARNTWEPMTNLVGCEDLIDDYEKNLADRAAMEAERDSEQTKESEPDSNGYEVESIAGHKDVYGQRVYLVKWKTFSLTDATWEPEENLNHCPELLEEYWTKKGGRHASPVGRQRAAKSTSARAVSQPSAGSRQIAGRANRKGGVQDKGVKKKFVPKSASPVKKSSRSTGKKQAKRKSTRGKAEEEGQEPEGEEPDDAAMEPADPDADEIVYNGIGGVIKLVTGERFFEAWIDKDQTTSKADSAAVPMDHMRNAYPDECKLLMKRLKNKNRGVKDNGNDASQSSA